MNAITLANDILAAISAQNARAIVKFHTDNELDIANDIIRVTDKGDRVEIIDMEGRGISLAWSGVVYASWGPLCADGVTRATRLVVIR